MLGLLNFPLLLVPLAVYNLFLLGGGINPWEDVVLRLDLPSGAEFSMSLGESLVCLSLLMLLFQALKATRSGGLSVAEKVLSALVFCLFAGEVLFVDSAATSTFFLMTMIALVDMVVTGLASGRHTVRRIALEKASELAVKD